MGIALRKEEFKAFFGLCFHCGVLKVRDELPTNVWETYNEDDLSFQTRLVFNASKGVWNHGYS